MNDPVRVREAIEQLKRELGITPEIEDYLRELKGYGAWTTQKLTRRQLEYRRARFGPDILATAPNIERRAAIGAIANMILREQEALVAFTDDPITEMSGCPELVMRAAGSAKGRIYEAMDRALITAGEFFEDLEQCAGRSWVGRHIWLDLYDA